jgi:hypothetical protein
VVTTKSLRLGTLYKGRRFTLTSDFGVREIQEHSVTVNLVSGKGLMLHHNTASSGTGVREHAKRRHVSTRETGEQCTGSHSHELIQSHET